MRQAEHFAALAENGAALAGNAKSEARLAPAQKGRTGASPAAVNAARETDAASAAHGARDPGAWRVGAPPAAVNAARGAGHALAERRAGAPHVAENAAATGVE